MRKLISTGSPFEKTAGYSRAVVQGDWCFVAGTTGYDYATMTMPDSVEAQARNCLATIGKALAEGGFSFEDVVRAHYYITDQAYADIVFPILGYTNHTDKAGLQRAHTAGFDQVIVKSALVERAPGLVAELTGAA